MQAPISHSTATFTFTVTVTAHSQHSHSTATESERDTPHRTASTNQPPLRMGSRVHRTARAGWCRTEKPHVKWAPKQNGEVAVQRASARAPVRPQRSRIGKGRTCCPMQWAGTAAVRARAKSGMRPPRSEGRRSTPPQTRWCGPSRSFLPATSGKSHRIWQRLPQLQPNL